VKFHWAIGSLKQRSSAVDVIAAMRAQRDCSASHAVYVSIVIATMDSGRDGMIT
jgi:hypothetical protein